MSYIAPVPLGNGPSGVPSWYLCHLEFLTRQPTLNSDGTIFLICPQSASECGASHVNWYDWEHSISGYDTYYYTMMTWLRWATFTNSCSNNGNVWTCQMTERNGRSALIVWNVAGDSSFQPATQYVDYRKFNGTYGGETVNISPGQSTTIGVVPIMFETN
jgi:hypothetical protein